MSKSTKMLKMLSITKCEGGKALLQRCQSTVASGLVDSSATTTNVGLDEYASAKPYDQIPTPKGWPIIGNLLVFASKENQINAAALHQKYISELGPIYKLKLASLEMVCLATAEDSQKLYALDGQYPRIASFELFERIRTGPLKHLYPTAGLLSSGENWHKVRSLVQQDMMRPKSALFYIDEIDELMDDFILKLEGLLDKERKIDDLSLTLYEFALDAIGLMFIGSKLGVLQGSEYGKKMIEKVTRSFEIFANVMGIPPKIAPYTPLYKEYVNLMAEMFTMSSDKINEAIQKNKIDGSLEGTILDKMLQRCGPDSQIPHVMANDALLAGLDTTGNTAAFLLYHLAINPDKQENLYQEIIKVIGKDGKMTEEALAEMRYLKACQQESARMAPVVLGTVRNAGQDMVLSGYQVPKDTFVFRMGTLMSNSEEYFDKPDKFLPERWFRGCPQHQKQKNPFANIPFGHGPRACVGQRFAKLELYMIAYKLIQKYRISYDGPKLGINYQGLGSPTEPLALKFEKRK